MKSPRKILDSGTATLGIELGSTNIKAVLVGPDFITLASGSHTWENEFRTRLWTYPLDAVWTGIQSAVANLLTEAEALFGVKPTEFAGIGISAMMHGYLPFDKNGELLVPFRTWRNTNTGTAAKELTEVLNFNFPLRWSASHLYQAILDEEPHLDQLHHITTLAGYVHWKLTGQNVIGVGDASGMFPINLATGDYDAEKECRFNALATKHGFNKPIETILPRILPAGAIAGELTEEGAKLLNPTGVIKPGIPFCPPEGDAGTGMVATNAVSPRTGNISAGTSIFAMIVLERALNSVHADIDIVATPAGDPVAMVHCNNGASELGVWAAIFHEFAERIGSKAGLNDVFAAILGAAVDGEKDGGGVLAYNYLAGETITDLDEGRPAIIRTPSSRLNLSNFARTQLYSIFATLSLGTRTLAEEGVELDKLMAHGGLFRTPGVAQQILAAFVDTPVSIATTASEGGAWGIAVLAAYSAAVRNGETLSLGEWLDARVFANTKYFIAEPDLADVKGAKEYLKLYQTGLSIEQAAIAAIH